MVVKEKVTINFFLRYNKIISINKNIFVILQSYLFFILKLQNSLRGNRIFSKLIFALRKKKLGLRT